MLDVYFMSPPSPGWELRGRANFRSREAEPVDAARARLEWLALAEAIEARGGTVIALPPPSDELTGLPFAAECGHVVHPEGKPATFLLPRMASPHRQGEREHWAKLATRLGLEAVDPGAGTWEAQGDVAEIDDVTLLFFGGRTDREGMKAAARFFPGEVLEIEIREPAFHGNMAVLPLPAADQLVVCSEVLVGDSFARLRARFGADRILTVNEAEIRRYATNGLTVGGDLLAPSIVPQRARRLIEQAGVEVALLDMRELCEKAGGASRCLVSKAKLDLELSAIPEEYRLAAAAAAIRA